MTIEQKALKQIYDLLSQKADTGDYTSEEMKASQIAAEALRSTCGLN